MCQLVDELYTKGIALKFVYLAQLFLSLISLGLTVSILLRLHLKTSDGVFSANLLILFSSLLISLVGSNVGTLLSCLYPLHVLLFRPQTARCYWLTFGYVDCAWIKAIQQVCTFAVYGSSCALAVERVISSLLFDDSKDGRRVRSSVSKWVGHHTSHPVTVVTICVIVFRQPMHWCSSNGQWPSL